MRVAEVIRQDSAHGAPTTQMCLKGVTAQSLRRWQRTSSQGTMLIMQSPCQPGNSCMICMYA